VRRSNARGVSAITARYGAVSARFGVASGTSGYIVCSLSIAIRVVAKMPATAAA